MSETTISILLFVHVTFIAVWVGSQVLVAVAVMPSLRRIADGPTRLEALSTFTRRFNFVAWFSLLLIVLTGGLVVGERIDDIESSYGSLFDLRWGFIFAIKMALLAAMVGLVGLHSFILGPRQLRLNREALERAEEGTRSESAVPAAPVDPDLRRRLAALPPRPRLRRLSPPTTTTHLWGCSRLAPVFVPVFTDPGVR